MDGVLRKDDVSKIFKVDRVAAEGVFDYLVEKEDIACQEWGSDFIGLLLLKFHSNIDTNKFDY